MAAHVGVPDVQHYGCRALANTKRLKKLKNLSIEKNDFWDEFDEAVELLEERFGDKVNCSEGEDSDLDDAEDRWR